MTGFVGRVTERAALAEALARHRLVTLTGTAGVGKTRLALEHVAPLAASAARVDLTDARTDDDVAARITAVRAPGRALVLLDACEAATAPAAPHIRELLARAPELRCLVTSRRALGLAGEHVLRIEPLRVPTSVDDVEIAEASVLLLDRARHEIGELTAGTATAAAIAAISSRLGGLPLAIELCARRLHVMTLPDLARSLERDLAVLGTARRDGPARHASLSAALAPSFDLLSASARSALAQLSILSGAFTLADARRVLDVREHDAIETLQELFDHALLRRAHATIGFELYASVRHVATAELGAAAEAARDRHDRACLARAEPSEELLRALERALATPQVSGDADLVVQAALAADTMLAAEGAVARSLSLLDAVIAKTPAANAVSRARAHLARAHTFAASERPFDARADRAAGAELLRSWPDAGARTSLVAALAQAALDEGRVDDARDLGEDVLAMRRAIAPAGAPALERVAEIEALIFLSTVHRAGGDLVAASSVADRARAMAVQPPLAALAVAEVARSAHDRGDVEDAARGYDEAMQAGALEPMLAADVALLALERALSGEALESSLQPARARLLVAVRAHAAAGRRALESVGLGVLGLVEEACGDAGAARDLYERAASRHRTAERPALEGLTLAWLGRLEASRGRLEEARFALDEGRRHLLASAAPNLLAVYDLCEAELELAEARAARARGDDAAYVARQERVSRRLGGGGVAAGAHARIARAMLQRSLGALAEPHAEREPLVISASGRWFSAPGGARASLETRRASRLILLRLALAREATPGVALEVAALVAAGWPGERILHQAAVSRVYAAVAHLRKDGLRDVLLRRDDGYLLDPTVPLTRAAD